MGNRLFFCRLHELTEGKIFVRRLLARRYAVLKRGEKLLAFDADCRHMRAPLETGEICDSLLKCSWHGWEYNLETGKCLTKPGMDLRHYQTAIEDDRLFLLLETSPSGQTEE